MMTLAPAFARADSFATNLYAVLARKPGNLFFSPASARLALAMTYGGARGPTATQMRKALDLPAGNAAHEQLAAQLARWAALDNPDVGNARQASGPEMQQLLEMEAEDKRIALSVVNRLWLRRGAHLVDEYTKLVQRDYHAGVGELDFAQAEPSRRTINKWVSDATHAKIPALIPEGAINASTKLVLTNAIYFKAKWQNAFQPQQTKDGAFTTPAKQVKVPLMHQVGHFSFADLPTAQILELPYGEGAIVMDIVLPKTHLAAVERELSSLPAWLASLRSTHVDVTLPRWKSTSALSLGDPLEALGMKDAFHFPAADFSGIDGTRELYIGLVVHQADIAVDEQGTEAAAATAVMMRAGGMPSRDKPVVFRADHAFLYVIRDTTTNAVLFMGRLADPS